MARRKQTPRVTPEQLQTFLQNVRLGMYLSEAAKNIGVTTQAISMRKKRDPAFRQACDRAEAGFELGCIATIVKSPDWRAKAWLVERRFAERWARPEIRAELNVTNVSADAIVNGISEALEVLAKRHAPPGAQDVDADAGKLEDRADGGGPDPAGPVGRA